MTADETRHSKLETHCSQADKKVCPTRNNKGQQNSAGGAGIPACVPSPMAGQRFTTDNHHAARSASSEGSEGNPFRVPPPSCLPASLPPASSLEGAWLEIFRTGDYGDRGAWSSDQLDHIAATYDPRLHAAPVVLGHPADDAPAYGWVRRLRRAGQSLWAQLEKVDPALEALLRAGRFAQRSVSLYTHFPPTGGPYLRHLGFLGAAPPAVKGLAPVRFAEAPSVAFSFDTPPDPEIAMSEPKSKLDDFFAYLRAFFTPSASEGCTPLPSLGSGDESVPADSSSVFSDRLTALEQRLDSLAAAKGAADETANHADTVRRQEQIANFVETLRARGRFPPAFDRWGIPDFMHRLAAADAAQNDLSFRTLACPGGEEPAFSTSASPGMTEENNSRDGAQPTPSLLSWFQDFLTRLPAVIEFRELTYGSSHESRVASRPSQPIRFAEPQRGMTIDPASVELAERAEALAADAGISYADALAQLREERRSSPTTA